jgi:hypothetical protein
MKLRNLITTATIISLITLIYSCKKDRVESQELNEYNSINSYFDQKKQHEQEYEIDSVGQNPLVGEQGTKIWLDKSKLMFQNGDSVDWTYTIKLIELYTVKDLVYYQMPSKTGSNIFTTEGTIRLRAFKNSQELVLRQGATWPLEMPDTNQIPDMRVYYGTGTVPNVSWSENGTFIQTSYGYASEINPLGWISCYKPISSPTSSTISFTSSTDNLTNVAIFVYIPDLQMLEKVVNQQSVGLPVGYSAKVFAIAINASNQLFKFYQEVNIGTANINIEVTLSQSSDSEIENMLDNL